MQHPQRCAGAVEHDRVLGVEPAPALEHVVDREAEPRRDLHRGRRAPELAEQAVRRVPELELPRLHSLTRP